MRGSEPVEDGGGAFILKVAGIERAGWLEQQHVNLFVCYGAVFDTAGNDEELALFEPDPAIAELHVEAALDDQEELVFMVMMVPHERTEEFDELDELAVQFSDDPGLPVIVEKRELLFEVDLIHMRSVAERVAAWQGRDLFVWGRAVH